MTLRYKPPRRILGNTREGSGKDPGLPMTLEGVPNPYYVDLKAKVSTEDQRM